MLNNKKDCLGGVYMLNKLIIWYSTGHAFALGAILALAHDYRVMRTKKGWFCLPEVKYDMLFGKATILLLR